MEFGKATRELRGFLSGIIRDQLNTRQVMVSLSAHWGVVLESLVPTMQSDGKRHRHSFLQVSLIVIHGVDGTGQLGQEADDRQIYNKLSDKLKQPSCHSQVNGEQDAYMPGMMRIFRLHGEFRLAHGVTATGHDHPNLLLFKDVHTWPLMAPFRDKDDARRALCGSKASTAPSSATSQPHECC